MRLKWPKTVYTLTDTALQVQSKGLLGKTSEQLYRYDTIISVTASSAVTGPHGTLTLTLSNHEPIVIHDVIEPAEHARKVKAMVAKANHKFKRFLNSQHACIPHLTPAGALNNPYMYRSSRQHSHVVPNLLLLRSHCFLSLTLCCTFLSKTMHSSPRSKQLMLA